MEALLVGFLALYLITVSLSIAEDCCKICSRTLEKSNLFFIEYREIIIALFIASLVCLIMWNPCKELSKTTHWNNLGLNLFAGIVGAAFTIFVLDSLAKKREEKAKLPKRLAAYEDIRLPFARIISLWVSAFDSCCDIERPDDVKDFFTPKYFSIIWNLLDLNSNVPEMKPNIIWRIRIEHVYKQAKNDLKDALDRNSYELPPDFYLNLHLFFKSSSTDYFSNYNHFYGVMKNMKGKDFISVPCHVLPIPLSEDFDRMKDLLEWLDQFYHKHKEFDLKVPHSYRKTRQFVQPTCMLPIQTLIRLHANPNSKVTNG